MKMGKNYLSLFDCTVNQPSSASTLPVAVRRVTEELSFQERVTFHCPRQLDYRPEWVDALFYYKATFPISFFLSAYVRDLLQKGQFYAQSRNTRIDQDDVVTLLPDGRLLLSLTKDTYEIFGMTGKVCMPGQNIAGLKGRITPRYLIEIDLINDPSYKPIGKNYARLKWCLEHTLTRTFNFNMSFIQKADDSQDPTALLLELPPNMPSSIVKNLVQCPMNILLRTRIYRTPDFDSCMGSYLSSTSLKDPIQAHHNWMDMLEWTGMLGIDASRIRVNDDADPFVSMYTVPGEGDFLSKSITTVVIDGFLPGPLASACLMTLVSENQLSGSWWAAVGHGIRDSPITWKSKEHGYFMSGENDYTLLRVQENLALLQTLGCHDNYQI